MAMLLAFYAIAETFDNCNAVASASSISIDPDDDHNADHQEYLWQPLLVMVSCVQGMVIPAQPRVISCRMIYSLPNGSRASPAC